VSSGTDGEPRIEPLREEDWDESLRGLLRVSPGGLQRPLNIFTTLARHPLLFRRFMGFGGALLDGRLTGRQRELVILRTAHLCRSEYEWAQHVILGRSVGLEDDEIEAVRGDIDAAGSDELEKLMLLAADEMHSQNTVSDATWAALAARLDDASLIELVMLVGQYHLVAMTIRTLRIALEGP